MSYQTTPNSNHGNSVKSLFRPLKIAFGHSKISKTFRGEGGGDMPSDPQDMSCAFDARTPVF